MVGNKQDQVDRREVSEEQAQSFAKELNVTYFPTSAKENLNIEKLFKEVIRCINRYREKLKEKKPKNPKGKCQLV